MMQERLPKLDTTATAGGNFKNGQVTLKFKVKVSGRKKGKSPSVK